MRVRLAKNGFWTTDKFGRSRLFSWWLPIVYLIFPIGLIISVASALNVSYPFFSLIKNDPKFATKMVADTGRVTVENLIFATPVPYESEIPTIRLFVGSNSLKEMQRAIIFGDKFQNHDPLGNKPYKNAIFEDENGIQQIAKVSYRGLGPYHHRPSKPSLRVKVKKSEIASGARFIELTRPKDALGVRHQLTDMIAKSIDVMSTQVDPVRVFINNKYYGVYLRSYRPGEPFALMQDRMPGTFFKGDAMDIKFDFPLWDGVENWTAYGEDTPEDRAFFDEFLTLVREGPTQENVVRLWDYLDFDAYAKWSASMIVGSSVHTDSIHNQLFFLCTNQGKIEPVIWDPITGIGKNPGPPVDFIHNAVLDMAASDPRWIHRRNEVIAELAENVGSTESLQNWLNTLVDRQMPDLKADLNIGVNIGKHLIRTPLSVLDYEERHVEALRWAKMMPPFFKAYVADSKLAIYTNPDGQTEYFSHGNVAIDVTRVNGAKVVIRDDSGETTDRLYPGLMRMLTHEAMLLVTSKRGEEPHNQTSVLRYTIEGPSSGLIFKNAITGDPVLIETVTERMPIESDRSVPTGFFAKLATNDVTLGPGVVTIKEDLNLSKFQKLTILPGTTLRMGAGVNIFSDGLVVAKGTASAPIIIEAATDEPWGAIGISGADTSGTVFEHVRISHGSTGRRGGQLFKGMLSVYDCPDVRLADCEFGINLIGDDAVNLGESKVEVIRCTWEDANSDALDLDMCTGVVRDCKFIDSGNDGLDMMESVIWVLNTTFQGSGDKGISVGEGTRALIDNITVANCEIGIEIKDASQAFVRNSTFIRNNMQVHAYQKKWIYNNGGAGLFQNVELVGRKRAWLEKRTQVVSVDSNLIVDEADNDKFTVAKTVPESWQQLAKELEKL